MEPQRPVVVVTGFGPFGIHSKNASWEAVKLLPHMNLETECDVTLVMKEIPVAYDEVDQIIPTLWQEHKPLVEYRCVFTEIFGERITFRRFCSFS